MNTVEIVRKPLMPIGIILHYKVHFPNSIMNANFEFQNECKHDYCAQLVGY